MRRIVIGFFGYQTNKLDGQTIKTRSFYSLLKELDPNVKFFDTEDIKINKVYLFRLLYLILVSKEIYFFPAHNSLKMFFPKLYFICNLLNIKLYYFMIGGWLTSFLRDNPKIKQKLACIDKIYCETYTIKKELSIEYEFNNLDYFPNFREIYYKPIFNKVDVKNVKLVYVGRINKSKGILDLFKLEEYLLNSGIFNFSINLYGQVEDDFKTIFFKELANSNYIKYIGVLDPTVIQQTLVEYDLMLFPTHNYTEGLPGTVLDGYLAGIPVIASNWKHASEYVEEGETGFVFEFSDTQEFFYKVDKVLQNPQIINEMKPKAWGKSWNYTKDYALGLLIRTFK